MHPILFSISPGDQLLTVKAYSFFLALAVIAAVIISSFFFIKRGIPGRQTFIFLLAVVPAVPVGARLLHILSNPSFYAADMGRMFSLNATGFALYGGLILAVFTAWAVCRVMQLSLWRVADAVVPGLGVGIAVSRIGCFLNGCCFGRYTDLPWGILFPPGCPANPSPMAGNGFNSMLSSFMAVPVHPTQLYELAAALLGTVLALLIMKRQKNDGIAFLFFVICFSAFRWINWHFRVPSPTFTMPFWFYPLLYAGIIVVAGILLYKRTQGDGSRSLKK